MKKFTVRSFIKVFYETEVEATDIDHASEVFDEMFIDFSMEAPVETEFVGYDVLDVEE